MKSEINKKAIKAGIANFFGSFFVKAISFLTVPIFTNLLSPNEFGEVSIFQTYLSLGIILICLHFDSALQVSKIDFNVDYDKYASTMVRISLFIFFMIFTISIFNVELIAKLLGINSKYVLYLIIFSFQDYIISYYMLYNITKMKYKMNLFFSIFNVIGSIVLSFIFVQYIFTFDKGLGRILGIELIKTPIALYILSKMISIKTQINFKDTIYYFKYTIKITLPQIFNHISHTIMGQCDRLVINYYLGLTEVGIYSITYTFGTILEMIHNSIENVWRSWFFENLKNNNISYIKRISLIYVLLFSIMAICFSFLIDMVFKLFISSVYWDGLQIVIPIMLGVYFLFMSSFYISVEYYQKQNKIIAFATSVISFFNLVTNILFIPKYGYQMAAYTTLLSYLFLYLFHFVVIVVIQKNHIYNDYIMMIICIFTTFTSFVISFTYNFFLKCIIGLCFVIPLLFIIYRIYIKNRESENSVNV